MQGGSTVWAAGRTPARPRRAARPPQFQPKALMLQVLTPRRSAAAPFM
jgi:hypothetical protein